MKSARKLSSLSVRFFLNFRPFFEDVIITDMYHPLPSALTLPFATWNQYAASYQPTKNLRQETCCKAQLDVPLSVSPFLRWPHRWGQYQTHKLFLTGIVLTLTISHRSLKKSEATMPSSIAYGAICLVGEEQLWLEGFLVFEPRVVKLKLTMD
jgi:hypothetical protein